MFNLKNFIQIRTASSFFSSFPKLTKTANQAPGEPNADIKFFRLCMEIGSSLSRLSDRQTIEREIRCRNPKNLQNTMEWGMVMIYKVMAPLGNGLEKLNNSIDTSGIKMELLRILEKLDEDFKSNGFHDTARAIPALKQAISLGAVA